MVGATSSREGAHFGGPVGRAVAVDAVVCTQLRSPRQLVVAARNHHHARTLGMGNLHGEQRHAARAHDDHGVAWFALAESAPTRAPWAWAICMANSATPPVPMMTTVSPGRVGA